MSDDHLGDDEKLTPTEQEALFAKILQACEGAITVRDVQYVLGASGWGDWEERVIRAILDRMADRARIGRHDDPYDRPIYNETVYYWWIN